MMPTARQVSLISRRPTRYLYLASRTASAPVVLAALLALCACEVPRSAARRADVPDGAPAIRSAPPAAPPGEVPSNIVFLIGDGMGVTQITAGMYASGNRIAFERMRTVGLHKSYSSDNLVTDSAAGATAFSCGVKTYNGAIGVRPDGSACPTLFEYAGELDMPTGLVVTSTIVHATPAAFYAHEKSRKSYENIAEQLASAEVDFFVGGGQQFFDRRKDNRDLIAEMRADGRTVESYFDKGFTEVAASAKTPYAYFTAANDPLPAGQGRDYLRAASTAALDHLEARDTLGRGFFLMIEGSQIDWGGHAKNGDYIVSEMQDFSRTVDAVLDWAQARGNTLVVVTADHETGGFAINNGSTQDEIVYAFTSDYHTADMIPVFAEGPGAELFGGIYENTAIYGKLRSLLAARATSRR